MESEVEKAREALCLAAMKYDEARSKALAAIFSGVLADFDAVDLARYAVLNAARAYARAAQEEGEKHGE